MAKAKWHEGQVGQEARAFSMTSARHTHGIAAVWHDSFTTGDTEPSPSASQVRGHIAHGSYSDIDSTVHADSGKASRTLS
jgi:hypothetical protein